MIYIFPGSFDPPTYGHVLLAVKALTVFENFYIVCSSNPSKKDRWFSPEECVEMWKSYDLPKAKIVTFDQMKNVMTDNVTIVRGLRHPDEIKLERDVINDAYLDFSIIHYHYILCLDLMQISSTYVKQSFIEGKDVSGFVSKEILLKLKEFNNKK